MRKLMDEVQEFKKRALSEMQNLTTATINRINEKNKEATQMLNEAKKTAVNVPRQCESVVICEAGTYFTTNGHQQHFFVRVSSGM